MGRGWIGSCEYAYGQSCPSKYQKSKKCSHRVDIVQHRYILVRPSVRREVAQFTRLPLYSSSDMVPATHASGVRWQMMGRHLSSPSSLQEVAAAHTTESMRTRMLMSVARQCTSRASNRQQCIIALIRDQTACVVASGDVLLTRSECGTMEARYVEP